MAKRINKADKLVFKALQKAVVEEKLQLCLIGSKLNIPGSPVYNPWEALWPVLIPVLFGLILIGVAGVLLGLAFMTAGIMLSDNLIKKKMEQRLFERAKTMLVADYDSCCDLWNFGGLVLVKADDKKQGCIAPEGNWKEFVILNFADLMTDKQEQPASDEAINAEAA